MIDSFILEKVVVGPMETNCYILGSPETKEALIIDPGDEYSKIKKVLNANNLNAKFIINTHGHIDHIGVNDKFNLPVYIHCLDEACFSDPVRNLSPLFNLKKTFNLKVNLLEDKDKINIDKLTLEVIHTPGHTPGGICLKIGDSIFTGDTLFCGGVGRTDLPDASHERIIKSIKRRLLKFDDKVEIYPGHGPSSKIGHERRHNPFL